MDGKVIELPGLHRTFDGGHGIHGALAISVDEYVDDIDVTRSVHVERHDGDDIMIISNGAIDEAAKANIRSILSSSGHTEDVVFVDREGLHETVRDKASSAHNAVIEHRMKIISKEVSETN